jgi:hypothetical protein
MDIQRIRQDGDTVLLSFSCGKDSLACWVNLRDAGFKVVPFYMQLVPGLAFIERSLRYYEEFFGAHIYRVNHPNFYAAIDVYRHQPPWRKEAIDTMMVPIFKYGDVEEGVKRTAGLKPTAWTAVGTRFADSPLRRARMNKQGFSIDRRHFFPICEFLKSDVVRCLAKAKVKLPIDYALFGRSFDGIDYRFLRQIKDYFPEDYVKILEWFPEAGAELFRGEVAKQHGQARLSRKARRPRRAWRSGARTNRPAEAESPTGPAAQPT